MNELALFAGAGGGILGGHLLGWRTVCAVEWEPYPASVLCARQNDGFLPPFPVWDDVQTFDGHPWRGIVDVISGGFPCQDISAAGKGDGLDGERSGMWRHMARVVGEVRPRYVFVENSPMLTTRGGTRVVGDLTALGYDCRWTVMGASHVGANHQRERMWIVASRIAWRWKDVDDSESVRWGIWNTKNYRQADGKKYPFGYASENMAHSNGTHGEGNKRTKRTHQEHTNVDSTGKLAHTSDCWNVWRDRFMGVAEQEHHQGGSPSDGGWQWWQTEPNVGRVADGVAARVDRLKAIGNGQVPLCAAEAWRLLNDQHRSPPNP